MQLPFGVLMSQQRVCSGGHCLISLVSPALKQQRLEGFLVSLLVSGKLGLGGGGDLIRGIFERPKR